MGIQFCTVNRNLAGHPYGIVGDGFPVPFGQRPGFCFAHPFWMTSPLPAGGETPPLRRETIPSGSGKKRLQTRIVTTWVRALPGQLHRNLIISHFFSSHFTGIIKSNDSNKSFSFSSPLFCCRVPAARQRVFCRFFGAIPKTA